MNTTGIKEQADKRFEGWTDKQTDRIHNNREKLTKTKTDQNRYRVSEIIRKCGM